MTLAATGLVLYGGTLPDDTPLETRVQAAVAGGFDGLSLWPRDVDRARAAGYSDAGIRAMFDDNGIHVPVLEAVWSWLPGADRDIPPQHDPRGMLQAKVDDFLRLADTFGIPSLIATDFFGGSWTLDDAAEAFAALCDRTAGRGVRVLLEFLPWSRIGDVSAAAQVVRTAGRANGGVLLDTWHFFRGRPDFDALRAAADLVSGIQLNDAPRERAADLPTETLTARLLPGEGDFDLMKLLDVLDEADTRPSIGVEVFSTALQQLDPLEIGRRAGYATRAVLGDARR
jgi:sugar phosphate isomerase/epimerase